MAMFAKIKNIYIKLSHYGFTVSLRHYKRSLLNDNICSKWRVSSSFSVASRVEVRGGTLAVFDKMISYDCLGALRRPWFDYKDGSICCP